MAPAQLFLPILLASVCKAVLMTCSATAHRSAAPTTVEMFAWNQRKVGFIETVCLSYQVRACTSLYLEMQKKRKKKKEKHK